MTSSCSLATKSLIVLLGHLASRKTLATLQYSSWRMSRGWLQCLWILSKLSELRQWAVCSLGSQSCFAMVCCGLSGSLSFVEEALIGNHIILLMPLQLLHMIKQCSLEWSPPHTVHSMFGNKRKYSHGLVSEGQLVFKMIERDTGRSLAFSH